MLDRADQPERQARRREQHREAMRRHRRGVRDGLVQYLRSVFWY